MGERARFLMMLLVRLSLAPAAEGKWGSAATMAPSTYSIAALTSISHFQLTPLPASFSSSLKLRREDLIKLSQISQRNFLVTVGEDEQIDSQQSAMCLKVFDFDNMQAEGTSSGIPDCIGILRIFTNQFPQAKITSFLVLEELMVKPFSYLL